MQRKEKKKKKKDSYYIVQNVHLLDNTQKPSSNKERQAIA